MHYEVINSIRLKFRYGFKFFKLPKIKNEWEENSLVMARARESCTKKIRCLVGTTGYENLSSGVNLLRLALAIVSAAGSGIS